MLRRVGGSHLVIAVLVSFVIGFIVSRQVGGVDSQALDDMKEELSARWKSRVNTLVEEKNKFEKVLSATSDKVSKAEQSASLLDTKLKERESDLQVSKLEQEQLKKAHQEELARVRKSLDSLRQELQKTPPPTTSCPACPTLPTASSSSSSSSVATSCPAVAGVTSFKSRSNITLAPYGHSVARDGIAKLKSSPHDSVAIHIVSHTHWDREWYRPLEQFARLMVTVVDNVVDSLVQTDRTGLKHFHLDAQSILLEDYFKARPSSLDLVRQLVENNQLASGPWYTQPDEFLVSGEALVRNLLYGIATLRDLNMTATPIGYIPDQFGHTSQMPQIFVGFDMIAAATMRGVPRHINRNSMWRSPDGTEILLLKFSNYCGMHFNEGSPSIRQQVDQKLSSRGNRDADEKLTTLYWMNGCDHRDLDTAVGTSVRSAQEELKANPWNVNFGGRQMQVREVVHSNLQDIATILKEEIKEKNVQLPILDGELRTEVDHLADVTSSGMSLKRRNWQAQELLESWAEPLNVARLMLQKSNTRDESDDLIRAWKLVLENHFHDTLCTTSAPQVLVESRVRADRAIEIAETISSQAMHDLMTSVAGVAAESVFVFNPTNAVRRNELVVAYLRTPQGIRFNINDAISIVDVQSKAAFHGNVVQVWNHVWDYRHRRGMFRQGIVSPLLKVAFRPPEVLPNEMRHFQVSYAAASLPSAPPAPVEDKTISNEFLKVRVGDNGDISIESKDGSLPAVFSNVNSISVVSDNGSQYLAAYGQAFPLQVENLKIQANAQYESAFFALRGTFGLVHVAYILPKGAKEVWVRVWFSNFEDHGRNFAVRMTHSLPCDFQDLVADMAFDHVRRNRNTNPDTKPHHRWVLAMGNTCALGVAGRGLYETRSAGGSRSFTMTMMRAVSRIGDWAAFSNDGAQDFGHHAFEYSIVPLKPEGAVEAMALAGRKFHSEMCAVQNVDHGQLPSHALTCVRDSSLRRLTTTHPGPFWENESMGDAPNNIFSGFGPFPVSHKNSTLTAVTASPETLVLSAVKRHHNSGNGIVVRVYNPTPGALAGTITFAVPIVKAHLANMNEIAGDSLTINNNNQVAINVAHHKIITVIAFPK